MRNILCKETELKEAISFFSEEVLENIDEIHQLEEDNINGIKRFRKDNNEIIFFDKKMIIKDSMTLLRGKYSLGMSCDSLEESYIQCAPYMAELNVEMGYINIIQFISMGILLGIPKEKLQILVEKLDEVGFNDILFDFIVGSYGLKRSIVSNKLEWGKPYNLLIDIIKEANINVDKASKLLSEYTEKKWIEGHANCGWKNFHKEPNYVGLWSFEAGVVAKILKLDDSTLTRSIHYPYDLVHYREDISLVK